MCSANGSDMDGNKSVDASVDMKSEEVSLKSDIEASIEIKSEDLSIKKSSAASVDIKSEDLRLSRSSKSSIDIKSELLSLSSVEAKAPGIGMTRGVTGAKRTAGSPELERAFQAGLRGEIYCMPAGS